MADKNFIIYPNPDYTPVTDMLADGTLIAHDEVSGNWSTRTGCIYRKGSNGAWIKKNISIWDKYVRRPNNHSRYPQISGYRKPIDVHAVVARAWLGPIPAGYQVDHIDGNNKNNCVDNLRLVPTWLNHRDGGFIKKLRNQGINPTYYAVRFLLRFFERMAEYKTTHSVSEYTNLTRKELLKLLVEPEFTVGDPSERMEYEMTHHCEC